MTVEEKNLKVIRDAILTRVYEDGGLLTADLYARVKYLARDASTGEIQAQIAELEKWKIIKREYSSPENDRFYLTRAGRRVAARTAFPDKERLDRIFGKVFEKTRTTERANGR